MPAQEISPLALGDLPIGTHVISKHASSIRYQIIGHTDDGEHVKMRRVGGELNRATVELPIDSTDYVPVDQRRPVSKARRRAAQRADEESKRRRSKRQKRTSQRKQAPKSSSVASKANDEAGEQQAKKSEKKRKKGNKSPSKGDRYRSEPTISEEEADLDPRNPFSYDSRKYAYCQALINGDGEATAGELMDEVIRCNEALGITGDDRDRIKRDLHNHINEWGKGNWNMLVERDNSDCAKTTTGRIKRGEFPKVRLKCISVMEIPWGDFVENGVG